MKLALEEYIIDKGYTKYSFSKESGVPWSTLCALLDGKSDVINISFGNAMKICKTLNIKMEYLFELCEQKKEEEHRQNFEIFKSNVCHDVKREGDIKFIHNTIESDDIRSYYNKKWYPESFYLLATVDYLCRVNDVEINYGYDDIRENKLDNTLFPESVNTYYRVTGDNSIIKESINNSIPEFLNFNIVEADIRNVK